MIRHRFVYSLTGEGKFFRQFFAYIADKIRLVFSIDIGPYDHHTDGAHKDGEG